MTKLASLTGLTPLRPTDVEGVYLLPVNFSTLDKMREFFADIDPETDATKSILWAFENLFCDREGKPFSDVSEETVRDLDIATCNRLMTQVQAVLVPPNSQGDQPDN